jgi:outer membrane biosynthesis protein TonB
MRIGAAISVLFHLVLVAIALVLGEANLLHSTPAEAITVDIVSSKDAPPSLDLSLPTLTDKPTDNSSPADSKPAESKPESKTETKPAETKPPETKPAEKKQIQTASKASQQDPPPAPSPPPAAAQPKPAEEIPPQAAPIPYTDITQKFSKLVGEGDGDFDAPAASAANISLDSAKALREHLKTCSVLPKSVSPSDNVKIVLRVSLLPNGNLAKEPLLIQGSASEKGPALLKSATDALLACQPYSELPADKYNEWKMLDLTFAPKDFKGG